MTNVALTEAEIRLLLQSLDHCLATCQKKDKASCDDCDAARALREKLARQVKG